MNVSKYYHMWIFLLFIKKKNVLTCDVCKNLDLMYTFSNLIILQFNLKKYNKNTKLLFFFEEENYSLWPLVFNKCNEIIVIRNHVTTKVIKKNATSKE